MVLPTPALVPALALDLATTLDPIPALVSAPDSLGVAVTALVVPLLLASLVYLDARRRRGRVRSRGKSLTPLAWGATTFFSGVGCVVVAACYVAIRLR